MELQNDEMVIDSDPTGIENSQNTVTGTELMDLLSRMQQLVQDNGGENRLSNMYFFLFFFGFFNFHF
jgi:hypothetical protein